MAFSIAHPHTLECSKTELDLFALPTTQTAIERSQWVEFRPLTTVSDGGPIEFIIPGSGEDYCDLSETYLMVTAKITKPDGSSLNHGTEESPGPDAGIGPVNLWLHSLFSQVDLSLNERLVTPSMNTYPYRAYIKTLLSYGPAAKKSYLTAALWYKDAAGHMDDTDTDNGFVDRQEWVHNSKECVLFGRPHLDLCFQDRLILNGVDMKMRLVRSKDAFSLMGAGKVVITDAALLVRKVKLNPAVQLAHIKALNRGMAKYPIQRVETKVFSIPQGNMSITQENLFLGQLPKRLVIGCVDNDAFNGSTSKNPFNFKHNNINFLALYLDGNQIPSKPYTPDFDNNNDIRSYISLFTGTGQMNTNEGNHISRKAYGEGYSLFAFNLSPDSHSADDFQLIKQGSLRLEMHFKNSLSTTINVVVYAEFDNIIEVDKARNILHDYSSWIVWKLITYWKMTLLGNRCFVVSLHWTRSLYVTPGGMFAI